MSTIKSKQDCTYARTAQDIERKYAFGKTFSETLGLINDNRNIVDSVESKLKDTETDIKELETTLRRDAAEIVMQAKKELQNEIENLSSEVELKVDADAVNIAIERELSNGADRVETKTGFKFDVDGLNISKSGTEIENLIDETGMYVKKNGDDVLTANKDGVDAVDLHAKTYLIIGEGDGRSRFEDYGTDRTGCFWIGG